MAFLFVIKVCTSDSTLVLSVRCGDPSAPSLAALAPQLQIIGHTGERAVLWPTLGRGEAAVVEGLIRLGGVSLLFKSARKETEAARRQAFFNCCRRGSWLFEAPRFLFFTFLKHLFLASLFFFFCLFGHVLAEVVVCAVGWVVTLPAMEMTAQATALLVLVPTLRKKENVWNQPPFQRCFTV